MIECYQEIDFSKSSGLKFPSKTSFRQVELEPQPKQTPNFKRPKMKNWYDNRTSEPLDQFDERPIQPHRGNKQENYKWFKMCAAFPVYLSGQALHATQL